MIIIRELFGEWRGIEKAIPRSPLIIIKSSLTRLGEREKERRRKQQQQ
jgi:hypothetical protein